MSGNKKVIFIPETNDSRVGAGAIGNSVIGVIDHVGIVYIYRVAVGVALSGLCACIGRATIKTSKN